MEFKELFWISFGKESLSFRNNLLLLSGLHSTKKDCFVFSTESEQEYSNKQGAWKFITKTRKTEVGNDVKLSVL